ncbi:MAG: hypothetical protein UR60_C0017G0022 [Candidatus Moranbacteria bacterium GW2011_GWF2_34_56]|nr:MAG: hypothetical protein UR51_C0015G0015 [Candidatus Moranbacteria bacterium GW2011_GWF1_34_10]KKP64684.1 MAG: hypothetical protein UR60_C0017G0022 [Candidatus Moranbacteria bacterium GW2011_GWF2_34_56]HBI17605.1 hypothetical protein [Candidatus Moranbacteria bacterium]
MSKLTKNKGVTKAEQYLGKLCEKSFLSLWSYPGLFKQPGKELCDLLVMFGDHIIIFSDKDCEFPKNKDIKLAWSRWYKRAVSKSAEQIWGAERWIKQFPEEIYLDASCKKHFPFKFPDIKKILFHLVVVTHQGSKACKNYYGGSGSMIVSNDETFASKSEPFVIGDLDTGETFVHFFDDTTLDIVMKNIDTVTDFVSYLDKKEKFFRSEIKIISTGEEELLAHYLKRINNNGEHDFILPNENANCIFLSEGNWEEFEKNPQRLVQKEADRISYFWDYLIERFAKHAQEETQYFKQDNGLIISEKILNFLAKESRFKRRMLAKALLEAAEKTPINKQFIRCKPAQEKGDPAYVFLMFPWREDKTERENREARIGMLDAVMRVVKFKYPESEDIIGIATESGRAKAEAGSEDAGYLDARNWTEKNEEEAKKLQQDFKILINPVKSFVHDEEYPDLNEKNNMQNKTINKYREDENITGVPENIYPYVLEFCKELPDATNPIYIPVKPDSDAMVKECFANVEEKIKNEGGKIVYGWQVWEFYGVMIEAEFHAIWLSPKNELIDITPKELPFTKILFVETPNLIYENKQTNNIRKSLLKNTKLADEFIETYNRMFNILNEGDRSKQTSVRLSDEEKFELINLGKKSSELLIKINNLIPGRNDLCRCGSGKKYKKCHGK